MERRALSSTAWAETGISSRAPKPIQALQAKELAWAREVYKPEFDVEGLPIGMTDNYDHLTTEEKSHNRVYLAFREFQKFGVVESMMVLRKEFTSFGEIDILYGMDIRPFDKPAIAHTWKKDAVYGRQFVAGTNPIMLQAVSTTTAFPPPALKSFSIDSISLVPVLAGKDVKHLISQGRFTFVDYRPYLAPFVTEYKASEKKKNGGTIVAPVGLFYHDVEGAEVYPIGIQLEDGGYIFHPSTTLEPEKDCAWLTAKMWLALADTQVHELSTHLFKVHLCVEPFGIALHRQLPRSHPVFKLVTPHMDGTMQINAEGREIFIPVLAQIFSMGDGIIDFFKHVHSNLDFFELGPVKDLEKRGFGADSTSSLNMPGQYPWAEDARDLWEILTNYCDSFLALHYANDAAIAADTELQAWIKECATFFRYKGVPTSLSSRSQLTQVVATIIWTGSAQHSSVNYPQYEYYGFPPNRPPKTYLPVPKQRDDSLEERKAVAFLPPAVESLIAINTAATLAQYNEYDNYLGDRKFDYFGPAARQELGVMTQFSQDLVAYDGRIKARNETLPGRKENPYKWLLTTQIVASTRV
ncbi:lipoxygenase [Chytriomyces sp. MP71]|nr:lipoxygenase [Chytriomyces sp. MP71]